MSKALAKTAASPLVRNKKTSVVLLAGVGGEPPVTGLVRTDERGAMVALKALVPLSEKRGELWTLKGKTMPTALGLRVLNQFVGVTFLNPETVAGDKGGVVSNPYHRRDEAGLLVAIRQRKIGLWVNVVGNPVAYDYTLEFDLMVFLAENLFAKWAKKGYYDKAARKVTAGTMKDWGRLRPDKEAAEAGRKDNEKAYMMPDGSYLVVDLNHPDVVAAISDHIHRRKFATALCDTFCERNILKKAIAVGAVGPDGLVSVVVWQTSQDDLVRGLASKQMDEAMADAMSGMEVSAGREKISDPEQVEDVVAREFSEDDAPPPEDFIDVPSSVAPSAPAAPANPELQQLRTRIREIAESIGDKLAEEALGQAGVDGMEEVGMCGDVGLLKAAVEQLEKAQMRKVGTETTMAKGRSPRSKAKPGNLDLEGGDGQ